MTAWGYGLTVAAISAGLTGAPAGAQSPADEFDSSQAVTATTQQHPKAQHGSWDAMGMRGFSVALVLGDLAGTSTPDNLPGGAKKALSDMRDFLPYKSYRLLDTHWILCCSSTQAAAVAGRLRGVEEEEYAFNIDVRPANDWTELAVRFNLRDASWHSGDTFTTGAYADTFTTVASSERERRLAELKRQRDDLEKREALARERVGDKHPDVLALRAQMEVVQRQLAESETTVRAARARAGGSRQILDSTFSMKVGETVVIGTSRLKGDKALIALLTAASKTTPSAR